MSRDWEQVSDEFSWFFGRELYSNHGKILEQNSDSIYAKGTIGNDAQFANIYFCVLNRTNV